MKMICGGTTAEIIARELGLKLDMVQYFADMSLPPASILEGFDLVTEGILTISKVEEILENYSAETRLYDSPAEEVAKRLLQHDIIYILLGTRINWAHLIPISLLKLRFVKQF